MIGNSVTFNRQNGGRFQIGEIALQRIGHHIQNRAHKKEAGGVLLGRHILESVDIIVDTVTEPMPGDKRERYRFFRSQYLHQLEIDRMWEESLGTCTYLGEWHTHPEQYPSPSDIDRLDWAQRLRRDQFTEPIFFVIVGTEYIRVWEGWRNKKPIQLEQSRE